jgi:hypothetical protein
MDTTERIWLPAVIYAFLFNRAAATVFGNIIWIYENEGVTQIPISNQDLRVEFQIGFAKEMGNADRAIHKGSGGARRGAAALPVEVYVCCIVVMFFVFLRSFEGQIECSSVF